MNQEADVEVSADGGSTWQSVYTEQSEDDSRFFQRTVSLSSFAKKQIILRFRVHRRGDVLLRGPRGLVHRRHPDRQRAGRQRPGHERHLGRDRVLVHADPAGRVRPAGPRRLPREWVRRLEQSEAGLDLSGEQRCRRRSTHRSSRGRPPAAPAWAGQTAVTHDGVDALAQWGDRRRCEHQLPDDGGRSEQVALLVEVRFGGGRLPQGHRRWRRALRRHLGQHGTGRRRRSRSAAADTPCAGRSAVMPSAQPAPTRPGSTG